MSLVDFIYKYNYIGMILLLSILLLLIIIISISIALHTHINNENSDKFNELLKVLKGFIYSNSIVIVLSMIFWMFINIVLSKSRTTYMQYQKQFINKRIASLIFAILAVIGLTVFIMKTLEDATIYNGKDKLLYIYIIIPIMNIVSFVILSIIGDSLHNNLDRLDVIRFNMNNNIYEHTPTTRMSPPSSPSLNSRTYSRSYSIYNNDLDNI
jgi:hypothetical protein